MMTNDIIMFSRDEKKKKTKITVKTDTVELYYDIVIYTLQWRPPVSGWRSNATVTQITTLQLHGRVPFGPTVFKQDKQRKQV